MPTSCEKWEDEGQQGQSAFLEKLHFMAKTFFAVLENTS